MTSEETMRKEVVRFVSYTAWPDWAPIRPLALVRAGFYYSGFRDVVICHSCDRRKGEWKTGDIPIEEHVQLNPQCSFIMQSEPSSTCSIPHSAPDDDHEIIQRLKLLRQTLSASNSTNTAYGEISLPRTVPAVDSNSLTSGSSQNSGFDSYDARLLSGELTEREEWFPEKKRLLSFFHHEWKYTDIISPGNLARAGFHYTGSGDNVSCVFCTAELHDWQAGDDAENEHRMFSPTCPFMLGGETGNIPLLLDEAPLAPSADSSNSRPGPVTSTSQLNDVSVSMGNLNIQAHNVPPDEVVTAESLGIITSKPRHPEYVTENLRMATFHSWPRNKEQTPKKLSEAGFYYANYGDNVKCFFCDVGLRNWEPTDDPWVEHVRWNPRCAYVRQCKGDSFIARVIEHPEDPESLTEGSESGPHSISKSGSSSISKTDPHEKEHPVDPREVKARMDMPMVQAVLGRGYSRAVVKKAIEEQLQRTGDDFGSPERLVEGVFAVEERLQKGTLTLATSPREKAMLPAAFPGEVSHSIEGPRSQISEEAKSLLEENRNLREQRLCKICMDEEANIVFVPCGHLVSCQQCAPIMKNCPICRKTVKGTVKTYLS